MLNTWDRALLDKYLNFYEGLHSGKRAPATAAQRHFLEVLHGHQKPRTQHEIAYTRYLQTLDENPQTIAKSHSETGPQTTTRKTQALRNTPKKTASKARLQEKPEAVVVDATFDVLPSALTQLQKSLPERPQARESNRQTYNATPSSEQIAALGRLEEAELYLEESGEDSSWISSIKRTYVESVRTAKKYTFESVATLNAALGDYNLTSTIERWMGENWNTLSNAYTKAVDGAFAEGLKAGADYASPSNHRLFDGHSLNEMWKRCQDALPNDTSVDELIGFVQAALSDMSSKTGLPLITLDSTSYEALVSSLEKIGIPKDWIHDALHFNTYEVATTVIPGIALFFNWSERDKENFARLCGSALAASLATANPLMLIVAIVAMAIGYDKAQRGGDNRDWLESFGAGGLISGLLIAACSIVGPTIFTAILAIGLVWYVMDKKRKIGRKELPTMLSGNRTPFSKFI